MKTEGGRLQSKCVQEGGGRVLIAYGVGVVVEDKRGDQMH